VICIGGGGGGYDVKNDVIVRSGKAGDGGDSSFGSHLNAFGGTGGSVNAGLSKMKNLFYSSPISFFDQYDLYVCRLHYFKDIRSFKTFNVIDLICTLYEPRHDKSNIMGLRPAWIYTSLRFRAV
jgi:hypothetical protein